MKVKEEEEVKAEEEDNSLENEIEMRVSQLVDDIFSTESEEEKTEPMSDA